MRVTVTKATAGDIATVGVAGELDLATRQPLLDTFDRLHDEGRDHLVVDLGDLTFIDSSGINALISGLHAAEGRGGWLRVVNIVGPPRRAMELSGVLAILSDPWRHTGPSWVVDGTPAPHTHDEPPRTGHGRAG